MEMKSIMKCKRIIIGITIGIIAAMLWCEHFKPTKEIPDEAPDEGPDEMFHFIKVMK